MWGRGGNAGALVAHETAVDYARGSIRRKLFALRPSRTSASLPLVPVMKPAVAMVR